MAGKTEKVMPDRPICLFVARHGRTVLNADNCFRGKNNVPLDDQGHRDAHKLADYFEGIQIGGIICSDKIRAHDTARVSGEPKALAVHPTPSLQALNVGDFSGQKKTPENVAAIQSYVDNPSRVIPGGESLEQFQSRVRPALAEALKISDQTGLPWLVVGHSSIVHEVGSMFNNDHHAALVKPGGVAAVYIEDGHLASEPIFKPDVPPQGSNRASHVS